MERYSFIARALADRDYQNTIAIIEGDKLIEELDKDPLAEFGENRHRVCVKLFANIPFLWMSERIIVPVSFRKHFLNSLHQVHSGNEYAYRIMSSNYYWPELREEIVGMLQNCQLCQEMRELNRRPYQILANR